MNSQQITEMTTKAIEDLSRALEAGRSETLSEYLAAIGRFHKYSLHNVMLIVLQKPTATHVAGFHTWHKLGRHVRKGEKGITIFAPILRRKREPESASEEKTEELLLGYRTCAVFDISQTEGKPLPAIAKVQGDARHFGERLAAYALSLGIRLEYSPAIAPARGISEGGRITLLPDMPSAEHAAVLTHELAHEILHHQPRRAATTRTVRETEAEAVAYVVCRAIGLETGTASADYIQLHRGDAKLLLESLNYVRLAAGRILDGIVEDRSLPEFQADWASAGAAFPPWPFRFVPFNPCAIHPVFRYQRRSPTDDPTRMPQRVFVARDGPPTRRCRYQQAQLLPFTPSLTGRVQHLCDTHGPLPV